MRLLRPLIGPTLVVVALWCAAGQVTVADDAAAVRIAIPPALSLTRLAVAALLIAVIAGWRRSPWTAVPALIATLPWWPVPMPAIALIWTGPLAFLPILCAAGLALSLHPPRWRSDWIFVLAPAHAAVIAGVLAAIISGLVAWRLAPRLPGGDEPHYLVITQSLLSDGDLKIQNNHDRGDYRAYYGGELRPDYIPLAHVKDVYSIHSPGLAAAVLPGFAVSGYRGAQATILLLAAIAAALVWLAAFQATRNEIAAWIGWAATVSSLTFLVQSVTIFPDAAGMAAVAAGVWLLSCFVSPGRAPRVGAIVIVSASLAALPWLHSRFVVLAAGLGLAIIWQISGYRLPAGHRETLRATGGEAGRMTRLAAFVAIPALSAIAWLGFFKVVYGTFSPSAPYGPEPVTFLKYIPGGLVALFVDQQFGLLTFAPVFGLGVVALFARDRTAWFSRTLAVIAVAYLAAAASYWMWWAGVPAPPARLATAALPLLAVPVAVAWTRGSFMLRAVAIALLVVSVTISACLIGIDRGALAWDVRGPAAAWLGWLGPTADLTRGWPSFFWRLVPGDVTTEAAFAAHAAAWLAVWTASIGVLIRLARQRGWPGRTQLFAVAWWLPVTLMIAVLAGWRLDRAAALRPLASQLEVLRATAADRPGLRIAGFSGQPFLGAVPAGLRLRVGAPVQDADDEKWSAVVLNDLPGGVYQMRVVSRRPVRGLLRLSSGPEPPFQTITVAPLSQQTFTLHLPAAMSRLIIAPDEPLKRTGGYVDLVPIVVPPPAAVAIRAATSPAGVLFFVDDNIFIEPDAFWVRGGQTTELIVRVDDGRGALELTLSNGAAANNVTVTTDAGATPLALAPFETRAVTLTVPPSARALRVRIASPAGFTPAETGKSDDRRFLGVRVQVR